LPSQRDLSKARKYNSKKRKLVQTLDAETNTYNSDAYAQFASNDEMLLTVEERGPAGIHMGSAAEGSIHFFGITKFYVRIG